MFGTLSVSDDMLFGSCVTMASPSVPLHIFLQGFFFIVAYPVLLCLHYLYLYVVGVDLATNLITTSVSEEFSRATSMHSASLAGISRRSSVTVRFQNPLQQAGGTLAASRSLGTVGNSAAEILEQVLSKRKMERSISTAVHADEQPSSQAHNVDNVDSLGYRPCVGDTPSKSFLLFNWSSAAFLVFNQLYLLKLCTIRIFGIIFFFLLGLDRVRFALRSTSSMYSTLPSLIFIPTIFLGFLLNVSI